MKVIGKDLSIRYQRESEEIYTTITPIKSIDGNFMLGLWVRDAAAGIGTLTYYEEDTKTFAALGHGINDVDTNKLLNISNGELVTSQIISIVKGEKGKPGEIRGIIEGSETIGNIEVKNYKEFLKTKERILIALFDEEKTEEISLELIKGNFNFEFSI